MKLVKKFRFLVSLLIVILFAQNVSAVLFDFKDAPYLGVAADIEAYMEDVYGSDITVVGGIVGDGIVPGPLGPDHYIQAGPTWGTHWFSFSFNEVPITSVSFDWAVEIDTFHAYADDVEFGSASWGWRSSGNTGTVYFDCPVTTLKFTNSMLGEIEVDNLIITPVPEPATVSLLGLGALTLLRRRRG